MEITIKITPYRIIVSLNEAILVQWIIKSSLFKRKWNIYEKETIKKYIVEGHSKTVFGRGENQVVVTDETLNQSIYRFNWDKTLIEEISDDPRPVTLTTFSEDILRLQGDEMDLKICKKIPTNFLKNFVLYSFENDQNEIQLNKIVLLCFCDKLITSHSYWT